MIRSFLKRRRLREYLDALGVGAGGVVVRIDGHVDVPFVGLEEVKVEAGKEGGDAHVEFCVCEAERVLVWSGVSLRFVGG